MAATDEDVLSTTATGTPDYYLERLVSDLIDRHKILDLREDYVAGNHPLPSGDRRYYRALRELQEKCRTNYCGLACQATVQRMRVTGFRFGGNTGEMDEDAKMIWASNDMDLQSAQINANAAKYGLAYAMVSPPTDGEKWPIITNEDPRITTVARDPIRPTRFVAALRMWLDDVLGQVVAVLYMKDTITTYLGPKQLGSPFTTTKALKERLLGAPGGEINMKAAKTSLNPLGAVPVVEFVWRPGSELGGGLPEGEIGPDLMDVQDRINTMVLERMVISKSQAYNQRWATNVQMQKGKRGGSKPPFDAGADMVWTSASKDTKFGQFTAADLRQLLEAAKDDIADFAAISQTPAHYLMGKMANISGETLAQAETGLVSKIRMRMTSLGWSYEKVMKICFLYLKDGKADEVDAETIWADPEKQTTAELADAGVKWSSVSIPLELIMRRQNWSPDDIEFAVKKQEEELARQERMAEQQFDQQMQMAKMGAANSAAAKPSKPGAGKPGTPSKTATGNPKTKPKAVTTKPTP